MENQTTKNPNWGGLRKNAGRKRKYGEKTKVLTIRVSHFPGTRKCDDMQKRVLYVVFDAF